MTNDDMPNVQRTGTQSITNPYPIYHYLNYLRLSPTYSTRVTSLAFVPIPKTAQEASPRWPHTMIDEMTCTL